MFRQDLTYAWRMLRKSPLITSVAVLSLALSIGANTATFSLINALLLRRLPVPAPQELVSIGMAGADRSEDDQSLTLDIFKALRREQTVFTGMFAWIGGGVTNMEANGTWYPGSMNNVSGEYYATLGVKPFLGRLFGTQDIRLDQGWAEKVAVLDYRCWTQRFGSDPGVLGKTMHIDDNPVTIIGVTPREFTGLYIDGQTDLTAPLGYSGRLARMDQRSFWFDQAIGRLKPGVSIEQARAQLETIWPRILARSIPQSLRGPQRARFLSNRPVVEPAELGFSFQRSRLRFPLRVFMVLVAILLSVACLNLANLMLARAAARQHEFAVRLSLGASRSKIARQLLVEGLLLSFAGGVIGLLIATQAARLCERMLWRALTPIVLNTDPDWRVLLFTLLITLLTGACFSLAPVGHLRQANPAGVLGQSSRTVRGGTRFVGRALVTVQLALSLVLLIGAALFAGSIQKLQTLDAGFRREGVLTMLLSNKPGTRGQEPARQVSYYRALTSRLTQVSGVQAVAYSSMGPGTAADYPARAVVSPGMDGEVLTGTVSPGLFHVLGIRILQGRDFNWTDDQQAPLVAIVSESLARNFFPGRYALGQSITLEPDNNKRTLTIVGIVSDAILWSLKGHHPMAVYEALSQNPYAGSNADVKIAGDPLALAGPIRHAVESLGRQYPILIETVDQREGRFLTEDRVMAFVSAFLAGLAALLASVGLYGVQSLAVTRRTGEIGVRMAVGASQSSVIWMVLGDVMRMCAIGIPAGVLIALAVSKWIAEMLYALPSNDPAMIAMAVCILVTAAFAAGYLPARKAASIEPMEALRSE